MGEGVVVRPDQVSLGVLVNAVPRDAVDDAVAACGVREKRSDGTLPAHVITYLTLALSLFPDDDYEEVATKVTGSLDQWNCWNAAWTVPTSSAITQARKRLWRASHIPDTGPNKVRSGMEVDHCENVVASSVRNSRTRP